jgi:hypothetical protein
LKIPKLPEIPKDQITPVVVELLEVVRYQSEAIQILKNEIAVLKSDTKPPKIKPSKLDKTAGGKGGTGGKEGKDDKGKRPGSDKVSKTANLKIHETVPCKPTNIPEGSIFKGYKDFVVQGIVICPHNVLYRMERWQTPDGSYVQGMLPDSINGHFAPGLISYIQYQYHQCHVTQPLLLEQLREFGVDISSGQVNRILVDGNCYFHEEKDEILNVGLAISSYINTDDTGARHNGKNGYCTHIGNSFFAWFGSTSSKSRINFLTLLQAGNVGFCLNDDAFEYFKREKLPLGLISLLQNNGTFIFTEEEWKKHLEQLAIIGPNHVRIATEGALIGNLFRNGFNRDLVIISDDAGQFNILLHALCWVHAERLIHKLVPYTEEQRVALNEILDRIWNLYRALNQYRENPTSAAKDDLEKEFDSIFQAETCYLTLNIALKRLFKNKKELLLVLDRPDIVIHNNASESDIREYVKRRKISGGTRSDNGRKSRDTFTSLKKTARKLKVSFWKYLNDRNSGENVVPRLGDLMRGAALNTC